ncbi:hypothetical protein Y887_09195 [Xanthomonas pisi DSM 18956]|nr:hypothetical protein Y887_09190 [Xanthomonas pisi DSM 18956]KLD71054.1 hypothetical protein Y887_09195 [Xanthomonas pisi DSM 18956]
MPWKNIAAIGGAVRISVVRIKPMPPCCNAWLLIPEVKSWPNTEPSSEDPQKAMDTLVTMSKAMDVMTASTDMEKKVPIP